MRPSRTVIEVIDWWDHCSRPENDWAPVADFNNALQAARTVGWIIKEDSSALTIASSGPLRRDDAQTFCGEMVILKAAIINRTRLKAPEVKLK